MIGMGQNCCCSSDACRKFGCQADKPNPYKGIQGQPPQGLQGVGLGQMQYDAYAHVTGAMNRLAAAIEAYNAIQKAKDPTR